MKLAKSKVHFIGVGGIGMSGLAELLVTMGAKVSGSDLVENSYTKRLSSLGVQIYKGHSEENIADCDVVVYSSAINFKNPEYIKALELKIPIIPRAEALAEIMRLKRGLLIAGTHGKTTTTSLLASAFMKADQDPTVVVGGKLESIGTTAQLGKGQWIIAEADESDGSFSKLSPEIVVLTNIDDDHLDHFGSFENLQKAFMEFCNRIPFYGKLIICTDDQECLELYQSFSKPKVSFGMSPGSDYRIQGGFGEYEVFKNESLLGKMTMPLPGHHNALNTLAALTASMEMGLSFENAKSGLESFEGVDRRFTPRGQLKERLVYDDYAHHPSEIACVLQAAKEKFVGRKVHVVFQPHRFTRLQTCWTQFLNCFDLADHVMITDVYTAGESPIDGFGSQELVDSINHSSSFYLKGDFSKLPEKIFELSQEGDVIFFLGAGTITQLREKFMSYQQEIPPVVHA